ncbi:uracil-DNA glycosylase family protein [Sphingomonas sp. H39-1-10]|uniref:uracil-DNA glycosylase family protein n=1 Tax=Sphingomonas pollutisoli TaxID=3030829 RepID=UPI0023B99335|nr:uracil-DNA glycosylase family protein [Sphingomonas pollutisoli]MDF0489541.1 uracil-DNA glycosylase family protein [Sphingomonas pollutisoli]
MGADQNIMWQDAVASALEWWQDAGIGALADESPRDWFAAPAPPPAVKRVVADQPVAPVVVPLPTTLDAFLAWRTGPDAPEAGWTGGTPIAAQGSPGAELMVLVDTPERDDVDRLLDGAAGRLFDRMLAAIGHNRDTVYLATLCTVRPLAGRIAPEVEERLAEIARHHVALVAPKRLLILGNATSRALLAMDVARARGSLRRVNHFPAIDEQRTEAVASFHPRLLLERPAQKAEAWRDLQMLIGGTGS